MKESYFKLLNDETKPTPVIIRFIRELYPLKTQYIPSPVLDFKLTGL